MLELVLKQLGFALFSLTPEGLGMAFLGSFFFFFGGGGGDVSGFLVVCLFVCPSNCYVFNMFNVLSVMCFFFVVVYLLVCSPLV